MLPRWFAARRVKTVNSYFEAGRLWVAHFSIPTDCAGRPVTGISRIKHRHRRQRREDAGETSFGTRRWATSFVSWQKVGLLNVQSGSSVLREHFNEVGVENGNYQISNTHTLVVSARDTGENVIPCSNKQNKKGWRLDSMTLLR